MNGTVLVVAETNGAGLRPISLEVVTAGRNVADLAGCTVTALIMGNGLADSAKKIANTAADRVLVVDDQRLKFLTPSLLAHVLANVIESLKPFAVIVPSTTAGIEYAPRVAARLKLPIASDCIGLSVEDGALIAIRPILGGRVQTAVKMSNDGPAIATLRQGSFERAAESSG
jgi:electron transfer flavoprotein alpha subunit